MNSTSWQFDQHVAKIFADHARQHIPNYDQVIDLTVSLCEQKLNANSPILEIGCAVGETVKKLNLKNFSNIHAVDNSQDMIDKCPADMANYYCSSEFPTINIKFQAILCNWTLHFIQDKISYLKKIFDQLEPGGLLVLSEKTQNSGLALEQYHKFKSSMGVSDEQIRAKALSLTNVMFIHDVRWYFSTLEDLGFKQIYIAQASWCFTTFVAVK
jgi:tRNA (cmo5U34)-methyltransferase